MSVAAPRGRLIAALVAAVVLLLSSVGVVAASNGRGDGRGPRTEALAMHHPGATAVFDSATA